MPLRNKPLIVGARILARRIAGHRMGGEGIAKQTMADRNGEYAQSGGVTLFASCPT